MLFEFYPNLLIFPYLSLGRESTISSFGLYRLTVPSVCWPNLPTAQIIIEIASIITTTIKILKIVPVEAKKVSSPLETLPIMLVVALSPILKEVKILASCKDVKANRIATAVTARTKKVTITCLAVSSPRTPFLFLNCIFVFICLVKMCEKQLEVFELFPTLPKLLWVYSLRRFMNNVYNIRILPFEVLKF